MSETIKILKRTSVILFISISWYVLSSFILSFLAYNETKPSMINVIISMIASYIIIITIWYLVKKRLQKELDFNFNFKLNFKNIIFSLIFAFGILLTGSLFIFAFSPLTANTEHTVTNDFVNYSGPLTIFVVMYPIIIAPIIEEIFFRGIFGDIFFIFKDRSKINFYFYVIMSSLIFSTLHLNFEVSTWQTIISFAVPFISGVFFSIQYKMSKNLIYPILTHILYNSMILFFQ